MEIKHPDVNERLARKCLEAPDEPLDFYFVSRRHWIELAPEVLVLAIYGLPIAYGFYHYGLGGSRSIAIASIILLVCLLQFMAIELYRWDNDLVFLTQHGLARRRFTNWSWQNFRERLTFDTGTVKPALFSLAGIDAGTLVTSGVERRPLIPLIPRVKILHARLGAIPHITEVRTRAEAGGMIFAYETPLTRFESDRSQK